MIYDIAIIGAGAAGLFAGASLKAERPSAQPFHHSSSGVPGVPSCRPFRAVIIDHNQTAGRKLLLAGGGQCNLTHGGTIKDFLNHYGTQGPRLRPVLFPYSNQAVLAFFEDHGVPTTEREDGKVFPRSLQGKDVLTALLRACRENGVEFQYSTQVAGLRAPGGSGRVPLIDDCWTLSLTDGSGQAPHTLKARCVLIATGGCSYAQTGSDGSLFPLLAELGVPLVRRRPALVPLFVRNYPFAELSGISFPNARLTLRSPAPGQGERGPSFESQGPVLLTHSCFSGPAILSLSRYVNPGDQLEIRWNAALSEEQIIRWLTPTAGKPGETPPAGGNGGRSGGGAGGGGGGKRLASLLAERCELPKRFVEQLCAAAGVAPDKKTDQLSKKERRSIVQKLLRDPYFVSDTAGFPAAMVTAGGVALDAVDLKTMASETHPRLYFAGEVLDVDGDTGGYNLQFAFSSGRLAAQSACAAISTAVAGAST